MGDDTNYPVSKREVVETLSGIVKDFSARINQLKAEQKAILENTKSNIQAIIDKYPDYNLCVVLDEGTTLEYERTGLPYENQPDLEAWGDSWASSDDDTDELHTR